MKAALRDYGIAAGAAIVLALLLRVFVVEAYRIPTFSMRPTLEAGDTIFVLKWPYLDHERVPARGEVVVFRSPWEPGRDSIKRVIGLPGDTVEIRAGHVVLNGKELPSKMGKSPCGTEQLPEGLKYGVCWEPPIAQSEGPETIPEKSVFVMGDLRSETQPARMWGTVPLIAMKGRAAWIWLSVDPVGEPSGFPQLRFERMFRRIR